MVVIPVLKTTNRERDDTLQPVILDDPFTDLDSPLPASPVNRGEPLKTIPMRLPLSSIFEIMCWRKEVVRLIFEECRPRAFIRWGFRSHFRWIPLCSPTHTVGRIGNHVVVTISWEPIVNENFKTDALKFTWIIISDLHKAKSGDWFPVLPDGVGYPRWRSLWSIPFQPSRSSTTTAGVNILRTIPSPSRFPSSSRTRGRGGEPHHGGVVFTTV